MASLCTALPIPQVISRRQVDPTESGTSLGSPSWARCPSSLLIKLTWRYNKQTQRYCMTTMIYRLPEPLTMLPWRTRNSSDQTLPLQEHLTTWMSWRWTIGSIWRRPARSAATQEACEIAWRAPRWPMLAEQVLSKEVKVHRSPANVAEEAPKEDIHNSKLALMIILPPMKAM